MTFVSVNPLEPTTHVRQKRGAFKNHELREETHKTRDLKACIRCRMQKIRCSSSPNNPMGSCLTCQNLMVNRKIHNLPCLRYRLTSCTEFRVGKPDGMQYSARWPVMKIQDISDWASPEIRTITVEAEVSPVPFELNVRKFVPIPQDSLRRSWMDGKIKRFKETTPYAIADMGAAMVSMHSYITKNVFKCMDYFLRNSDELIKVTFKFARTYMETRKDSEDEVRLLKNYMVLWAAVRRTATLDYIVGQDKLGMDPVENDKSSPLLGKVPLPPVMIQQLEIILTVGFLKPLQKLVLDDLQRLILANNPKTWMTIYLIAFMSLHSCSTLLAENYRNARRQGYKRRFSFPQFVQERHNSANVFLAHYHYRTEQCNPFKLNQSDWKNRHTTPFADMATKDVIFLQKTRALLAEKDRAEEIRYVHEANLYENELFFVSQMFEENWQPRDIEIDTGSETIYGGPVKVYYGVPTKS
ncbi:hypothetical protein B0T16DRAFT_334307 [Cercophora newfieldiana]|uniref:Zn(2)-C6 fungal-type domain-containing protein n=1 Tax=Cercophora newfieldiana TaxID=92897 RepID=A0AA39XZD8_9PEZI|nr:hypothetical protein B0T16DRAFT_334307 [Cercophora newfieldiana]